MDQERTQLNEMSASQAAKLFHLSADDIEVLDKVRIVLLDSLQQIVSRLYSRVSILPQGTSMLGVKAGRRCRGIGRWLDLALRLWHPEIRKPRLKHLGIFCAKTGVPVSYLVALFSCTKQVTQEVLVQAHEAGKLPGVSIEHASEVLGKKLATEQLALLSTHSKYSQRLYRTRLAEMRRDIRDRSERLVSTVSLSQRIAEEVEEIHVARVLAQHVMETFNPDYLAIHTIQPGDLFDMPVVIDGGELVDSEDNEHQRALRDDWRICRATRTGHLFHVSDVQNALITCPVQAESQKTGCYCCVPLTSGTEVFGCMHLRRRQPGGFSEEDIEVLGIYGQMVGTAITSLRLLKANRQQASTDPLTGLHNRRHFQRMLEKEELILRRQGGNACLVMIDVDGFKPINDEFGHEAGDKLLQALATTLSGSVRRSDELARFGGDEFIILLRDCNVTNGLAIAKKIGQRIGELEVRVDSANQISAAVCLGVAGVPEHTSTLAEAALLADMALLKAKQAGKNRAGVFGQQSEQRALAG